ncbi:DNA-binding Lrp family transcriptional regulator [Bradyrhizobium sp. JR6.1]
MTVTERPQLDDIDLRILSELQRDGRIRINELAERVGITAPPCLRRVRALRSRGVVQAIRATLDERLLGYEVTTFVLIQARQPEPGCDRGVRGRGRRRAALPAMLADLGRCRFHAEMRRAKRRRHASAAAAVRGSAQRAQNSKFSGARRLQGCAAANPGCPRRAKPRGLTRSPFRQTRHARPRARHPRRFFIQAAKTFMAGTSPAMTELNSF